MAVNENIECSFELCREVIQTDNNFFDIIEKVFGEELRNNELYRKSLAIDELLNVIIKEKIVNNYFDNIRELIDTTEERKKTISPFISGISENNKEKDNVYRAQKNIQDYMEKLDKRKKVKANSIAKEKRILILQENIKNEENSRDESLGKLREFVSKNIESGKLMRQVNEGYEKLCNFSFLIENKDSFRALFKDSPMLFQALEEIRSDKNFAASFREACKMQEIDESSVDKAIIKYTRILNLSNMKSTITDVELDENKLITKWGLSDTIKLIMLDEGGYLPLFKEHNDEMIGSLARYEVMVEKCVNTDNSDIN